MDMKKLDQWQRQRWKVMTLTVRGRSPLIVHRWLDPWDRMALRGFSKALVEECRRDGVYAI